MSNRVYLYPKNDISINLLLNDSFISEYSFINFIDKNKNDALKLNQINDEFDYIIICSPRFGYEIYEELLNNNIEENKIILYSTKIKKMLRINEIFYAENDCLNDYEMLKDIKNKHLNKRIFLIGNGPSLRISDLAKLKNEITFASNKIYLSFDSVNWRPNYYLVEDDLVYLQNFEKIQSLKNIKKFFPLYSINWKERVNDSIYFRLNHESNKKTFPQFNPDPIDGGFYWGSTVIYTMIQFAIYFGCKEIYLIGVDFSFDVPSSTIINGDRIDLICEGEVNHFHKDYRKPGEKWNLPNLDVQLKTFSKAKEYCDFHGIKIYNASRQTKLDVFDKIDFDQLFDKESIC